MLCISNDVFSSIHQIAHINMMANWNRKKKNALLWGWCNEHGYQNGSSHHWVSPTTHFDVLLSLVHRLSSMVIFDGTVTHWLNDEPPLGDLAHDTIVDSTYTGQRLLIVSICLQSGFFFLRRESSPGSNSRHLERGFRKKWVSKESGN